MKTIKAFLILLAFAGFATPVFGEDRECMSVAVVDGYIQFRNNCKSDIHHNYCIVNPDTSDRSLRAAGKLAALHGCDTGFTGWGRISAGGTSIAVQSDALGPNSEIRWFSCPMPALPEDWDWKTNQGFCRTTGDSTAANQKTGTPGATREDRRLLQMALTIKGFDTGTADGQFGPKTQAAIKAWQQSIGQKATGRLTASQVRQLLPERFGAEPQQAKATAGSGWTAPAPAVAAVALSPKCSDLPGSYPATKNNHAWAQCWQEFNEQPGCFVYRDHYHTNDSIRGDGECRGGMLSGTLAVDSSEGVYQGRVVDGKRNGYWILRFARGDSYEGRVVDGKRIGRWIVRGESGIVGEGYYDVNNKQDGRWKFIKPDETTFDVCFRAGEASACN